MDDLPETRFRRVSTSSRCDDGGFPSVEGVGESEPELGYSTPMTRIAGADVAEGRWILDPLRMARRTCIKISASRDQESRFHDE